MDRSWGALRQAARRLWRSRGVSAAAVVTLAVGIGANVVLFAMADAVLFRPFPFADQDRLVIGGESEAPIRSEVSCADFHDWRARARMFSGLAAIGSTNWTALAGDANPVAVSYRAVSGEFFEVLGARAALGRTLEPRDDRPDAPRVAVIAYGLWERQFGRDPRVVGRSIVFGRQPFTIVGVMPREFAYPAGADLWTPLVPDLSRLQRPGLPDLVHDRGVAILYVIGRLKPGVTLDAARADLNRVVRELAIEYRGPAGLSARLTPLVDDLLGPARVRMWALLAGVFLLLLATTANVAGLMLVRTASRAGEFAVRAALGATRASLARQLFLDSALLTAAAAVAGVLVARAVLPVVVALAPRDVPRLDDAALDGRVLAFTVLIGALAASLCALGPAVRLARARLDIGLHGSERAVAPGGFRRPRQLLIALEIAIAVVIVTATGLLLRSVIRLGDLDFGFKAERLLAVHLTPPSDASATDAGRIELSARAIRTLQSVPFVSGVAAVSQRPLVGPVGLDSSWQIEGQPRQAADRNPWVNTEVVTPSYFATLETPIVEGRAFTDDDRETTEPVVIVNHRLAARAWPGQSAIGRRIRVAALARARDAETWWTVVGVAADIRYREIGSVPLDVYVPWRQSASSVHDLMIRTRVPAERAAAEVGARLRALNPGGAVDVALMEEEVAACKAPWSASLVFFGVFAVITALLAAVGLYALLAALVIERTREIGVRVALGATRRQIVALVLAGGGRLVVTGAAAGVIGSIGSARLVGSLLFDVSPLDALTLAAAPAVLAALAMMACALPAIRAARLDPAVTLRGE